MDSSDDWHWCKNCSRFPTKQGYDTAYVKPESGLCGECQSKADAGECEI
ncbi:MAG: hypothetical protein NWF12_02905 [Candidatus Bathyarchaeota archaeon]|nr:hypothetical protein [Candidatus Bathyarchaeota archaeon]